jgi:environmental stress-induced protein Ves
VKADDLRVLRAGDYRRMPWKNGGGETMEIAVSPEGAGLDAFDWRVSMARVHRDGPFSAFPDVDRTLAILDGAGLRLAIAGRAPIELTAVSAPLPFPADLPTTAALADGPVLDLNVMTRRGVAQHAVDRLTIAGTKQLTIDGTTALLLCRSGSVEVEIGERVAALRAEDTLLVEQSAAGHWTFRAQPSAAVFLIRIRAAR